MAVSVEAAQDVRRSLDGAADAQITRVVALVDGLADRGEADALIAPLRPRLAQLRPGRVPTFGRALFAPLDTIIQPAQTWRRGALGIPRTALASLGAEVRAEMGQDAVAVETILQGGRADPRRAVREAGARLWPIAAGILRTLPVSAAWSRDTGLRPADHATIRGGCAAVLSAACDIEGLLEHQSGGVELDANAVARIVADTSAQGAFEFALVVAVILSRFPVVAQVLDVLQTVSPRQTEATAIGQAVDHQLAQLEAGHVQAGGIAEVAAAAGRAASLLDALERPGAVCTQARRKQGEVLRRQVDASCRTRFASELEDRILRAAAQLGPDVSDADIVRIEGDARLLRQFEQSARRLGGADHYDSALRAACTHASKLALPLVDRVRLIELLSGAEAAMALLEKG